MGGVGGGFGAEAAVVETTGRAGNASLAVVGVATVGVPGFTVLVCAATGVTAFGVDTVTAADFAVVVDTVTAPLTVVVGATVVVLSFLLPPNKPPKKPLDFFVVVGSEVVVVGLGVVVVVVVVVVVLGSFSLPPPKSPPKNPLFFLVVVGAGVVVLVVVLDVGSSSGGGPAFGSIGL